MKVSAQYAQEHFADILTAIDTGEEVELTRPGQPSVRLVLVEPASAKEQPTPDRRGLWGSLKGQIWLADDWDSDETNEEIARAFNDAPIVSES